MIIPQVQGVTKCLKNSKLSLVISGILININHAAYLGVLTKIKRPLGQPLSQVTRLSHGGASNLVMELQVYYKN